MAGASRNGVSITVTGSWSETAPLWQNQRGFIATNLQAKSSFPGIAGGDFLNPSLNSPSQGNPVGLAATATSYAALVANGTYQAGVPLFNLSPYQTILQQTDQKAITAVATVEIVPKKLTGFGDLIISDTHAFLQTNGFLNNLASVTVPAGAPYNPLTVAATGVIAGTLALPLQTFDYGRGERITGGFRGEINDNWSWEVGGTYSGERLEQDLANELFMPNIQLAVNGGYNSAGVKTAGGNYSQVIQESTYPAATNLVYQPALDPFARQTVSAASIANLYGTEVILTSSILKGVDAKLVGTPFSLPAGKFAVAAGAAFRIESLSATPDLNSYALSINPAYHNWGQAACSSARFSTTGK